jgi:hypothetical protein
MARPTSIKKEIICKNCNTLFLDLPSSKKIFCSNKCAQQFKGKDKSWLDNRKKTCLSKYGIDVAFKAKEVQDKYKQTMINKYGVNNPFLVEDIKYKSNQTIQNKYGCQHANQNQNIKDKISKSLKGKEKSRENFIDIKWDKLINYYKVSGMKPLFDKEHIENNKLNHSFKNKFRFQCDKCSEITEVFLSNGYLPSCKCSEYKGYSLIEDEMFLFLLGYIPREQILLNRRDILPNRLEIDIYIPSYNLAIEINGVYWHSESMGKYRDYHLYKTIKCEENNINLIHILDYEWVYKKPIIQSIILNKINKISNKIWARKCEIKEIKDINLVRSFLNNNHIQGYTHANCNLGLFYNNELVSLMTFSKNRFKKDSNELEMVRFCNKLNTNIIGGASKLFNFYQKNYNINQIPIISFADRRFFKGNLYKILGFNFEKNTLPSYVYWKDNKILNRMSCQKHKLNKLLDVFDPKKTEYKNMLKNGWRRVWDSGNSKWMFK